MNKLRRKVLKSGAMALFAAPALAALAANERGQPVPPPRGEPIRLALIESLSGPFANTGEAVFRNLLWATERVNARGGVPLPAAQGGARPLAIERHDSKGQNRSEERRVGKECRSRWSPYH